MKADEVMEAAQHRVLVLNAGYEPLVAISWQRAMCLLFKEKVEILESYDDFKVRSASSSFEVPAVIRLESYTRPAPVHTKFSRENVYMRDDHRCQYCGKKRPARELTFDHVQPKSRGGNTNWKNIVSACKPCNRKKADRTPREASMTLLSEPKMPNMTLARREIFSQGRKLPKQWEMWIP